MKAFNILLAVVGGAVAGAAVGLPQKGSTTRDEIVKYLKSKGVKLHPSKIEELADQIAEDIEANS